MRRLTFKEAVILASVVLVFVFLNAYLSQVKSAESSRPSFAVASSKTMNLISIEDMKQGVNDVRVQTGHRVLTSNRLLDEGAQARAEFLCAHNQWSHEGWRESFNYQYFIQAKRIGENLLYGDRYQTARTMVGSWVNSPAHYANMTSDEFNEFGMGIKYCASYQGQTDVVIVVNHFGGR